MDIMRFAHSGRWHGIILIILFWESMVVVTGFVVPASPQGKQSISHHRAENIILWQSDNPNSEKSRTSSPSSSFRPLYDGTNYTFPDTTSPTGIAELLEVSFVKACMQLASGYVDILKMFIAASVASYESGFLLSRIQQELEACTTQTANRPLMPEEETLRFQWICIIYLTLMLMDHPTKGNAHSIMSEVPIQLRDQYEGLITQIAHAYASDETIPSVEGLLSSQQSASSVDSLSEMDKAIRSQSLRVATLTPVVLQESEIARGDRDGIAPPKPPIKGAFD
jgi:hypothetical protein